MKHLMDILSYDDAYSLLNAITLFLSVNVIKKFVPEKFKKIIHLLPFALGIISSVATGYIFNRDVTFQNVLAVGIKSGGEAAFLYAIYRQLIIKAGGKKQAIEKILSVIVSKNNLKKVSGEIVELIKSEPDRTLLAEKISGIIVNNASVSEDVLSATVKLLFKAAEKTK